MQTIPFYIDQTGGISIAQLAARARRLKRQRGLDLLVIDYLQLLQGSSKRGRKTACRNSPRSPPASRRSPRSSAFPIIALSQLSRQVESRDDKRPQLSDLRESGSIEQDADVVMFVLPRGILPEEQGAASPAPKTCSSGMIEMEQVHGKAEVIIGKQRHGPTGTVQLAFEAASPASPTSRRTTDCRSGSGTDRHIFAFGGVLSY